MVTRKQLNRIRDFSDNIHKNLDKAHNSEHIHKVVKYSRILSKKENANTAICEAAAYLHDIGYRVDAKTHRSHSEKMASQLLNKIRVDKETSKAILHCIHCHDFDHSGEAKTIEAKVVHDADRLQLLGPYGFSRLFWYFTRIVKIEPKEALKKSISLQSRATKTLRTRSARFIAARLNRNMESFHKGLKEW